MGSDPERLTREAILNIFYKDNISKIIAFSVHIC